MEVFILITRGLYAVFLFGSKCFKLDVEGQLLLGIRAVVCLVWTGRWGEDFEFVSLWISVELVGSAIQKTLSLAQGASDEKHIARIAIMLAHTLANLGVPWPRALSARRHLCCVSQSHQCLQGSWRPQSKAWLRDLRTFPLLIGLCQQHDSEWWLVRLPWVHWAQTCPAL